MATKLMDKYIFNLLTLGLIYNFGNNLFIIWQIVLNDLPLKTLKINYIIFIYKRQPGSVPAVGFWHFAVGIWYL